MTSRGFFLVPRGWMEHPLLQSNDPFSKREAWIWLLENAAFRDYRFDVHGKLVTIKRGQICRGFRDLANTWKWSLRGVQRFIERLKSGTMIDTASDTGRLVITICNYDRLQSPSRNDDTATDTPRDTGVIQDGYGLDTQEKERNQGNQQKEKVVEAAAPPAPPPAIDGEEPVVQSLAVTNRHHMWCS